MRITLVLHTSDLKRIVAGGADEIWIAPGVPVAESAASRLGGCKAVNLNRFMPAGAISAVSREMGEMIRDAMAASAPLPLAAVASQNDLYQYHLRSPFYLLRALEEALMARSVSCLTLLTTPYAEFRSPMRPAIRRLHAPERTDAWLVRELARSLKVTVKSGRAWRLFEAVQATIRGNALALVRGLILCRKTWMAGGWKGQARATSERGQSPVAVLLRTASEVTSAALLCAELDRRSVPYRLYSDELLSSRTTEQQLAKLHLRARAIGSAQGLAGLRRALGRRSVPGALRPPRLPADATMAAQTIATDAIWHELGPRLYDFQVDQTQLATELSLLMVADGCKDVVTFAYIDQWGAIVADVAHKLGGRCIAVQNAAQDPEDYPRLAWSDHYCTESVAFKARLIELGYPPESITGTGLPQLVGPAMELQNGKVRAGHRTILVMTQPIYESYFVEMIGVASRVAARFGWRLVIKLHPRQPGNSYSDAIAEAAKITPLVCYQFEALDTVLKTASVAISAVSAAMVNAISAGVPLLALLPIEEGHLDLHYVDDPVTANSGSAEELEAQLTAIVNDYQANFGRFLRARSAYLAHWATFEPTDNPGRNVATVVIGEMRG